MFTGLVAGTGEVLRFISHGNEARLVIRPNFSVSDWKKGESIAVNGACLSVESFELTSFTAYASAETLQKTNLQYLRSGNTVNLERALAIGDRLGGHLVSGHIDGLATLSSVTRVGSSIALRFEVDPSFSTQVIPKGSVTLDGVSLTVNTCGSDFFEVNIIPETQKSTTIGNWRPSAKVNLETDLIGKYVQQFLTAYTQEAGGQAEAKPNEVSSRLTLDFLRDNGF